MLKFTGCRTGVEKQTNLAESIKYRIEIHQNLSFGDLGDIVEAFSREVPHSVLGVRKADEQMFNELVHVGGNVDTKSYRCPGKSYETTISNVKWVRRIAEHVHKLVDDLANAAVVALLMALADLPIRLQHG